MSRNRRRVKQAAEPAMAPAVCRRVREALKLTQEQMAEKLGLRVLTIKLWESGRTPISRSRALAIQALAAQEFVRVEVPYVEAREAIR